MMSDIQVTSTTGGGYEIWTTFADQRVVLVIVRPVGTLSMGELRDAFSEEWVPDLIRALQLAHRISSRANPWEPWHGDTDPSPQLWRSPRLWRSRHSTL